MSNQEENIDGIKKDVLKEIANIGAGHAATALAALLDRPIVQSVPNVMLVPLAEMPSMLGGAEKVVVAGMLDVIGDVSGFLLMVLDLEQADRIINMVVGKPPKKTKSNLRRFSAMDKSVLSETINILGGSYLTAIAEMTNLKVAPSIPYLCVDMVGAILSVAITEAGKTGDFAVFFKSELYNEKERIIGDLFLIPEKGSCDKIMESLGF
jgi:chemotaxis protein CheC